MNVANLFLETSAKYPDLTAIIEKDKEISFEDLRIEVLMTSSYFLKKGIKQNDRVLVFVPMGIDLYRIVLALFNIGATAVFLDEWVNKSRMEMCCEIAQCNGFIGVMKARVLRVFSKQLRNIPIHLKIHGRGKTLATTNEVSDKTSALITFTTGTTGRPKAANRTHGFLYEQFEALKEEIDPKPREVDMPVLPIVLFVNLGIGCTSVITDFKASKPEKMNVKGIIDQIEKYKVHRLISSPFFVSKLANYCFENKIESKTLKHIFTGGAPVFPKMARELQKAFPNAYVSIVYGSTEVEPISSILASDLILRGMDHNLGLPVGFPYHKTKVRIIQITKENLTNVSESELNKMELKDGEIGEIIVSGPHVLKSYFNSEAAFHKTKIVSGTEIWHRTGDSGRLVNGELFLNGRCDNLIYRNDMILSPFVIEEQLGEIDGIEMGTIIEKDGKLILVVESSLSSSEIKEKVNFVQFDELKVLSKIPRDPRHHSRIDYSHLKKLI